MLRTLVSRLTTRPWLLLALLLAATMILAACGGDDDDAGDDSNGAPTATADNGSGDDDDDDSPDPTSDDGSGNQGNSLGDPCEVLTVAEINAIMGTDYGEGVRDNNICEYENPEFHAIYIILQGTADFDIDVAALEMEEFDGPGKRTAWSNMFRTLDVLLDDNRVISFQVIDFSEDSRDKAVALAEKALE